MISGEELREFQELQRSVSCQGKGCGTDPEKACLRCCRIMLSNYAANHGTRCDAVQERLRERLNEEMQLAANGAAAHFQTKQQCDHLRYALQAALAVWCPHDPGGDGADGETYQLAQAAFIGRGRYEAGIAAQREAERMRAVYDIVTKWYAGGDRPHAQYKAWSSSAANRLITALANTLSEPSR